MNYLIVFAVVIVLVNADGQQQQQQTADQQNVNSQFQPVVPNQINQNNEMQKYQQQQHQQQQLHQQIMQFQGDDVKDLQTYTGAQSMENPVYDPSLYASFVPQDAVQQYVSQYGGPYAQGASAYSPGGYPPGLAIQTGYEGYLVPHIPPPPQPMFGGALSALKDYLPFPRTMISMVARIGTFLATSLGVLLAGGTLTTMLCTFTPLCSISFAVLPFLRIKQTAKELGQTIGTELTPDRIKRAADFVQAAIRKYDELQKTYSEVTDSNEKH